MTTQIFESWLHKIDTKFKHESYKVILFIDTCTSVDIYVLLPSTILIHQHQAIKLYFLPYNRTARLYPLNEDIILS